MRSRRGLVAVALAGLASAACVSADAPGVSIDSVEADVVFGIDKPTDAVVPANTNVGDIPADATSAGFDFGEFRNPAADRLPPLVEAEPTPKTCPTAPPTAAARDQADATITGAPREGSYLWQRRGTQRTPKGEEMVTTEIKGFERRVIRNVQPHDDPFDENAYTFEMVQSLLDRPVVQVRTFLVKPLTSAQVAPGGALVVDEPRANDPEGGVSLINIEEFDENDQRIGAFQPSNGLLYIGLPVDPAETFQSTATDPKTGQTIVQEATVRGRARIDACGDLVDGWRVESTQTRSDIAGTVSYNFLIATQYGGVPILEEISTTADDGSELNITFTLGQLDPDPLPSEA